MDAHLGSYISLIRDCRWSLQPHPNRLLHSLETLTRCAPMPRLAHAVAAPLPAAVRGLHPYSRAWRIAVYPLRTSARSISPTASSAEFARLALRDALVSGSSSWLPPDS